MLQRSQGRAAAKLLPVLAMLMIACSAGSASAAVVSNSCGAWGSRNTAYTANTAYPDTAAVYWATRFNYVRGLRFFISGDYLTARYMSFNVYTAGHLTSRTSRSSSADTSPAPLSRPRMRAT